MSVFARYLHFRRLGIVISNNTAALFSDITQCSNYMQHIKLRSDTTNIDEIDDIFKSEEVKKPAKKMSKAMIMYLQRAKDHDEFMKKEIAEYQIGKRHLANMMGEDPDCFTQADINKAIEYLFPSGLFDQKARPMMRHPEEIFPNKKAAEFDDSGRPFHSLFYTSKPNYYETLYNIMEKIKSLNNIEDSLIKQGTLPMDKIKLVGSTWLSKKDIEDQLLEPLLDIEYNYLVTSLERLCNHPLSRHETNYIMKYRKILIRHSQEITVPPLEHDSTGRPYIKVTNCMRKSARGEVTVWGNGSGLITINGHDITYFEEMHHREQAKMVDNVKFKSFSEKDTEENNDEQASRIVPSLLTRTSAASLFLTRLKNRHSSSKQDNYELESGFTQYNSPLSLDSPITSASHMDYSVISERVCSEEINRTCLRINEDFIGNVLTEHKKRICCKSQFWENLELIAMNDTLAETVLPAPKSNEINVLLLQASFMGRIDIICHLCQHGANINYTEPEHGLTPLHLCAFRNCLDGVKYLIEQGAKFETSMKHTPFHYAAFGDAFDVAQYLVQHGISPESSDDAEETVLHAAARTNALHVLSLLAPNSNELNRLDQDGYAAIHHAADRGDPTCLDVLLKAGCQVDLPTAKKNTALHLAAEAGCTDNLILLIEAKADLQLKNHRGYTALHLAARSHSLECVEILLKGHADPNAEDDEGRTPLHLALGKSLMTEEITELLLKWRANVNKADKYGCTPLHIAASNELSQCVDVLIKHEADLSARTIGGNSALSIVLRKTPTSLDVFERRLDASLTLNRQGFAGELELQLDFHPLLQHRRNRHNRLPEIGYLNAFVKEGYKEILEHPLCQSFLHLKWHKIRKYYAARLLFYLIYVLIFTSWVISALAHNCYNASKVNCMDIENHTSIENKTLCTNCSYTFPKQTELLESMWYVLAILSILEAFRKVSVIPSYQSVRHFLQIENLVEWFVIVSVFATSFLYGEKTFEWQNYLGAFAVLCGWSNLMLMIGQLPMFGAYVAMFTSVQAQVFKLLLAYACLLIGFTASFCVIFPRTQSFKSPHIGLTKVLVMMTGELNFEDFFFASGKHYDKFEKSFGLGQITVQLLFVLFLLFVTIVLMNLLIGIAVHDIKGLQKTAGLAKLVRQTKLIHDVEVAIFLGFTPSKRFIKFFRWTTLLLPSPLRAVLTVRPLNPREKRLPRDVLSASYKIAKEGDGQNSFSAIRKKSYFTKAYFKSDMNACRRRGIDEDTLIQDCNKFKDDIAELRKICEKNHTLLQELVKMKGINK